MSETTHTPGPWQASIPGRNDEHMMRITTAWTRNGCYLGIGSFCDAYVGIDPAEKMANARLAAAAPEILEALKEMDRYLGELVMHLATGSSREEIAEVMRSNRGVVTTARSVIAKAKGEA